MPVFHPIGFGTWNRFGEEAYASTSEALAAGYRHIDNAEGYENEAEVGRAIASSGLDRDTLWITSKVAPEHFAPGQIKQHAAASLDKLGLDYVDLYLLHYPAINDEFEMADYVAQIAEVKASGMARNIGVSNFTIRHIDQATAHLGDIPIFTNQVEIHPFMQNAAIVDHCRALGIQVTAYSPLGRGRVGIDATLKAIAEDIEAQPGQVALAYLLAEGFTVIPSSGNPKRIRENLAAQDITLTPDQLSRIRALDSHDRLVNGPWCPTWDENPLRTA